MNTEPKNDEANQNEADASAAAATPQPPMENDTPQVPAGGTEKPVSPPLTESPNSEVSEAAPDAAVQPTVASVESAQPATQPASPADAADATVRPKIQIGSQRDVAARPAKPKAVQEAQENPVEIGNRPVPEQPAPVEFKNPVNLDDDIESMLAGASLDQLIEKSVPDSADEELTLNSRVKAVVSRVHGEHVFVTILGRIEGIVPKVHFKEPPSEGQHVELVVINHNQDDNLYELAVPGASVAVADWTDLTEGAVVEARVTGSNTGGLEVVVNNIRGFIPASQIDRFRVENFGDYVNQKLQCVVMEVNPQKKKLVLSRRALLEREAEAKRKELMEQLQPGDTMEGLVTRLMDFGAFVDLGGVEGLVHISKLAWDRVTHPKEILSPGQKISVKIEKVEPATGRISLSYRDTMEHPWERIQEKYYPDLEVTGTVSKIAQFGAFVKLEPGIEGLVHISEIAHHRVVSVRNHVKVGDEVRVKILSVDPENQKMSLSIKATQPVPTKEEKPSEQADEPIREMAVSKTDQPLKGGTDRPSGGEQFGLKW